MGSCAEAEPRSESAMARQAKDFSTPLSGFASRSLESSRAINFRMRSERVPSVFFVSDCPDLHYNGVSLDDLSPSAAMRSNRPNLTLDEQSFQCLLSAAFTIQEHNDRRKLARQTPARQTQAEPEAHPEPEADRLCEHCGALMPADASRCGSCGRDEFRPGERMQPNWASMWLMSQEQGLWPECPPEIREGARNSVKPPAAKRRPQDFASNGFLASPVTKEAAKETITQEKTETIHDRAFDTSALDKAEAKSQWITEATENLTPEDLAPEEPELTVQPFQLSARDDSSPIDARTDAPTDASIDASGASTELLNCVPNHLLPTSPAFVEAPPSPRKTQLLYQRWGLILGTLVILAAVALTFMVGSRLGWWVSSSPQAKVPVPQASKSDAARPRAKPAAPARKLPSLTRSAPSTSTAQPVSTHSADDLLVYDHGKVIFRVKPSTEKSGASPVVDASKSTRIAPLPGVWLAPDQAERRLRNRIEPQYPADALAAHRSGDVVLEVLVAEDGSVSSIRTLSGDPLLAAAAADAVRQWRYEPYRQHERPSQFQTDVTLKFALPSEN
jgi:TonB family protein